MNHEEDNEIDPQMKLRANTGDKLYALRLLRDLETINERTLRELGPVPVGGLSVEVRRKPELSVHLASHASEPQLGAPKPILEPDMQSHLPTLGLGLMLTLAPCSSSTRVESGPVHVAGERSVGMDRVPAAATQSSDNGMLKLVPKGFSIRLERRGDIDGDGVAEVLLVLQKDDVEQDRTSPRALLILKESSDGSFEKIVEGRNAVLCEGCGGMFGDPLQDIQVRPRGFSLVFEGGSRELWARDYRFVFSDSLHTWRLDEVATSSLDRISGSSDSRKIDTSEFGVIPIASFDPTAIDDGNH